MMMLVLTCEPTLIRGEPLNWGSRGKSGAHKLQVVKESSKSCHLDNFMKSNGHVAKEKKKRETEISTWLPSMILIN